MRETTALCLALLALAAGCGGDEDQDDAAEATTALTDTAGAVETAEDLLDEAEEALGGAELTLDLREQNGSGISGEAMFSPTSAGRVEVELELDGAGAGPQPAHVHPGSCADLDPTPKWPLENVVDGRSKTTIDVSARDLLGGEYAVNVHESPENADVYVACADVRSQ